MLAYLMRFKPAIAPVSTMQKLRACLGALVGILVTGLVGRLMLADPASGLFLIPPMGASAVLLFAAPASPLAQPWSIIGGNLISGLIGVSCALLFPDPLIAAGLAVSVSIGVMMLAGCLHPPSGAVALTAVLGPPALKALGYVFVLMPVAVNSLAILLVAIAYNNLTGHAYPHLAAPARPQGTRDPLPGARIGVSEQDVATAMSATGEVVDISPDEIGAIIHDAERLAFERLKGRVTVGDVMSRDLVTVGPEARLSAMLAVLSRHHINALPVIDGQGSLLGVVDAPALLQDAMPRLLRRFRLSPGRDEPTARQLMTRPAMAIAPATPLAELVPLLSDRGLHQLPVIGENGRLVGIVTQSDLIGALFPVALSDASSQRPRSAPA